jgi:hypothetical protein
MEPVMGTYFVKMESAFYLQNAPKGPMDVYAMLKAIVKVSLIVETLMENRFVITVLVNSDVVVISEIPVMKAMSVRVKMPVPVKRGTVWKPALEKDVNVEVMTIAAVKDSLVS